MQVMCNVQDCKGHDFHELHKQIARGDIVRVEGVAGASQKGELSVMARSVLVESPCLQNLPLSLSSDFDSRRRQRHKDMLINEDVTEALVKRSHIVSWLRNYVTNMGLLEVETPILSLKSGGASATPFQTNSDPPLYLRIAPELYLKRLLVGGLDGVFEIGKQFRNEGVDKTHINEFTTMEMYCANWDYLKMLDFTEKLLRELVVKFHPVGVVGGIDFNAPFEKKAIIPEINKYVDGEIPEALDESHLPLLKRICEKHGVAVKEPVTVGRCVDKLCGHFVEPHCRKPTFLMDHPKIMSPLAKSHRTKGPLVSERFELFIGGLEYVNAYSELSDPEEQLQTLTAQVEEGDPESPKAVDYDYVECLSYGLPTCSGWGLGVDRLVMLITNTDVIDDVVFYPRETTRKD